MIPKFICWLFGHKRRTVHNFYGITMGRRVIEVHKNCPRCGNQLENAHSWSSHDA